MYLKNISLTRQSFFSSSNPLYLVPVQYIRILSKEVYLDHLLAIKGMHSRLPHCTMTKALYKKALTMTQAIIGQIFPSIILAMGQGVFISRSSHHLHNKGDDDVIDARCDDMQNYADARMSVRYLGLPPFSPYCHDGLYILQLLYPPPFAIYSNVSLVLPHPPFISVCHLLSFLFSFPFHFCLIFPLLSPFPSCFLFSSCIKKRRYTLIS